jgi:hypothetical protein
VTAALPPHGRRAARARDVLEVDARETDDARVALRADDAFELVVRPLLDLEHELRGLEVRAAIGILHRDAAEQSEPLDAIARLERGRLAIRDHSQRPRRARATRGS